MENLDLIAVGEIVKPQGIQGELKVLPLTDNPKRFGELKRVYFRTPDFQWKILPIKNYRLFNQFIMLKFDGIDDLNTAEALGRGLIYIPRNERPQLPKGRFYLDQIEGLKVVAVTGEYLGIIDQILQTGSNDVYIVKGASGEILIPALKNVVKVINLEEGIMQVELPPGLVEERK